MREVFTQYFYATGVYLYSRKVIDKVTNRHKRIKLGTAATKSIEKMLTAPAKEIDLIKISETSEINNLNSDSGDWYVWESPTNSVNFLWTRNLTQPKIFIDNVKYNISLSTMMYHCPWEDCQEDFMLIAQYDNLIIMIAGNYFCKNKKGRTVKNDKKFYKSFAPKRINVSKS